MGRIYDETWGRGFAHFYDRGLESSERAGLREMRRELLAAARGRTIDLGAGTGANLGLYPEAVSDLVLIEPDRHMARQLHRKLRAAAPAAEVLEVPAERLPFPDDDFDTAVLTLVLCTVPLPAAVLAETARVLHPGGTLLFIEHVRGESPRLRRWQNRAEKPWRFLADGCHCNRDTIATIEASPLTLQQVDRRALPKAPAIIRPLVCGSAVLAS